MSVPLPNVIMRGLFSARPAASSAGSLYFASDTGKQYRDNGATWDEITPVPAGTDVVVVDPGADPLPDDLPVVGGGGTKVKHGTKSGGTNNYATVSGSTTAGQIAAWDASGNLVSTAAPYDIASGLAGKPGASALVLIFSAPRAVSFAGNFANSKGTAGVNPTVTATYTINKNGSGIGTIAVSTGGVVTFTTSSGAAQALAIGDRLTVVAPSSQDATLADVAFTLAGTR